MIKPTLCNFPNPTPDRSRGQAFHIPYSSALGLNSGISVVDQLSIQAASKGIF
jgi:hypothetical protein